MKTILAIAAGGALGALLRHSVHNGSAHIFGAAFPWGTFAANIFGSFFLGLLVASFALFWDVSQSMKAFLVVGVVGSFTTFSAFSLDAVTLFERGDMALSFAYVTGSVLLSIAALYGGMALVRGVAG